MSQKNIFSIYIIHTLIIQVECKNFWEKTSNSMTLKAVFVKSDLTKNCRFHAQCPLHINCFHYRISVKHLSKQKFRQENKVWVKKTDTKSEIIFYVFIKKSTIFIQSLWNLVEISYSWVPYFSKVSQWLGKNCGFFNKCIFLI